MTGSVSKIDGLRVLVAGLAGGAAWFAGLVVLFGPLQTLLADPEWQSAKFLAVFNEIEPLPRVATNPYILPLGLVVLGIVHALVYAWIAPGLPGRGWRRGASFGLVAWALAFPWFEFYLPWNVMHEPASLVLLELVAWAAVMLLVGIVIAAVYRYDERT